MYRILARRHIHRLAEFAASNVLVAFDFDGTLAPITERPAAARMRQATRRLLVAVARLYPVIVISGRARSDLVRRVGTVPVWHLAGNHGVEPWGEHRDYPSIVRGWAQRLREELAGRRGVVVEDKVYSLTVHYRRATGKSRVVDRVRRVARQLEGARMVGGKDAISLLPRGAPHKGAALERARRLLACDTAIYIGDDDTDEDAFRSADAHRLLTIRVGAVRTSQAQYCLPAQESIDEFLAALIRLRQRDRDEPLVRPATSRG